jgi:UDP-N-acetylglucosamine:LPS N-acetylglucosamine transferase
MNKPFLTIPLISAKNNHQFENANFYQNLGCCWILSQKDFNEGNLKNF